MQRPESLPFNYREKAEQEPLPRVICDYIAGMTDNYISEQFQRHCQGM
jgi:dGTPase